MDSGILKTTSKICQQRIDKYSKIIEMHLSSVSDLLVVEAKYHKSCRSSFADMSTHRSREYGNIITANSKSRGDFLYLAMKKPSDILILHHLLKPKESKIGVYEARLRHA